MTGYFAGIDALSELSSLCIIDAAGNTVQEVMAASELEAIVAVLHGLRLPTSYVGLGNGLLSRWISDALHKAGFQVVLLKKQNSDETLLATEITANHQDMCNFAHLTSRRAAFATAQDLQKHLLLTS